MTALLTNGSALAPRCLLLAHGAGQPSDSPFMRTIAAGIAAQDVFVARFDFPYMARAVSNGRRSPPDRGPVLVEAFLDAIESLRPLWTPRDMVGARIAIGGKSMGGRIASQVAGTVDVDAVLCFGFPFHPPGKPVGERLRPLHALRVPCLILQGDRDSFGNREEVPGYALPASVTVSWLPDGDHGLKPRKASGRTEAENLDAAANRAADFLHCL